jgi:hypothetical protein
MVGRAAQKLQQKSPFGRPWVVERSGRCPTGSRREYVISRLRVVQYEKANKMVSQKRKFLIVRCSGVRLVLKGKHRPLTLPRQTLPALRIGASPIRPVGLPRRWGLVVPMQKRLPVRGKYSGGGPRPIHPKKGKPASFPMYECTGIGAGRV